MAEGLGDLTARVRVDTSSLDEAKNKASSFGDTFKGVLAAAGVAEAAHAIVDFGKDSVTAFEEAENAQLRLQQSFSTNPQLVGASVTAFENLAEAQSHVTKYSRTTTEAAIANLAVFHLNAQQMQEATLAAQDYASYTGKSLPEAMDAVGKAVVGKGGRALVDLGIKFVDLKDPTKNFNEVMDAMRGKLGGFAEKEGATAGGRLAELGNAFEDVKIKVGEALVPILYTLADVGQNVLIPALERIWSFVSTALSPVVSILSNAFAALSQTLSSGASPIVALSNAFGTVLHDLGVGGDDIDNAETAFQGLFTTLGQVASFLATTFSGVLSGVAVIFRDVLRLAVLAAAGTFTTLRQEGGRLMDALKTVASAIASGVSEMAAVFHEKITPLIEKVLPYLQVAFRAVLQEVSAVMPTIADIVRNTFDVIAAVVNDAVAVIQWIWQNFGTQITAVIVTTWNVVKDVFGGALNAISGVLQVFKDIFTGHWGALWGDVINLVRNAIGTVLSVIGDLLGGIIQFFSDLPGKAWNFISSAFLAFVNWGATLIGNVLSGIGGGFGAIVQWFRDLPGNALKLLASMFTDLYNIGIKIVDAIVSGVTSTPGRIANAIKGLVTADSSGTDLAKSLTSGAKSIGEQLAGAANPPTSGAPGGVQRRAGGGWLGTTPQLFVGGDNPKGEGVFTADQLQAMAGLGITLGPGGGSNTTSQTINVYVTQADPSTQELVREIGWAARGF